MLVVNFFTAVGRRTAKPVAVTLRYSEGSARFFGVPQNDGAFVTLQFSCPRAQENCKGGAVTLRYSEGSARIFGIPQNDGAFVTLQFSCPTAMRSIYVCRRYSKVFRDRNIR